MAKKNRTSSSRSSSRSAINLSAVSFVAVMLVGLALLAAFVLGRIDESLARPARIIQSFGLALAILVPVILSYRWARHQKQWVFVLWIIAIIVVLVFYVLNIVF